jgi:hypothetical protein
VIKEFAIANVKSGVSSLRDFAAVIDPEYGRARDDGDGAGRRGEEETAPHG